MYTVVSDWNMFDLIKSVNLKIQEGWQPIGGIFENEDGLKYQAMTKYLTPSPH